jgi:hypothetical protein
MNVVLNTANIWPMDLEYSIMLRRPFPKKSKHSIWNSIGIPYYPRLLYLWKIWKTLQISSLETSTINWSFSSWSTKHGKWYANCKDTLMDALESSLKRLWKCWTPTDAMSLKVKAIDPCRSSIFQMVFIEFHQLENSWNNFVFSSLTWSHKVWIFKFHSFSWSKIIFLLVFF